jgi:hypothetical protein
MKTENKNDDQQRMSKLSRNATCWCGSTKKYKKCCWPEKEPSTLYIQREAPANSQGTQPVKVLENNILHFFEKTNKDFLKELINGVENSELKAGIKYINEESKLTGYAYINSNKQIHIEETFLSYIWCLSYCFVTIFDIHVLLPRRNKNIDKNIDKLSERFDFLKYGLSLINAFSEWNIEKYPNPQKYLKENKQYIEKTNSVYLHAVNFVLCHEYSHFDLGHVDKSIDLMCEGKEITPEEHKIDEIYADFNAIQLLLKHPNTKKNKKNIEYGIVAGVSALLFLDKIGRKNKYPDPEIRLKNALEQLKIKDEDLHWGLASLALKIWTDRQNVTLSLPKIVDTYKDCFYLMIKEIEKIKNNS